MRIAARRLRRARAAAACLSCAAALALSSAAAHAQQPARQTGSGSHEVPLRGAPDRERGEAAAHHGETDTHGEHAAPHGEHDENAPPPPINWTHGLLGEKPGVEPSLLWRAPGEPPPFLASLFNFGLLVFIVVYFGKKPLAEALTKRKGRILHEIEESERMRVAAEQRLQQYEDRLLRINEELERVRLEFREQGEREKERIVREATERRDRMLEDARLLLAEEAKDLRHAVLAEVVEEATRKAAELLGKQMTLGDHDRFAEAALADVRRRAPARTSGSFGPPRGGTS